VSLPFAGQWAWLLLGAAVLGMLARRARVPYAVAFAVSGLLIGQSRVAVAPRLEPELVLLAFLPPLLFHAAFRVDVRELRRVVRPVLWLAVPGTLITTLVVGAALSWGLGLPLGVGLLFGTLIAATDPVAAAGVFARLGAPRRLTVLAEGEGLVNAGMAISLYVVVLALVRTGGLDPLRALGELAWGVALGVAVGVGMGILVSRLTRLIEDQLVWMLLSTALAYGSYLAAGSLGASGALACAAAGLVYGSDRREVRVWPETWARLRGLWEFQSFLATGALFLLVGFSADVAALARQAGPLAVAVAAVLAARVLVIEIAARLVPARWRPLEERERAVLVWGGLRGALTIALALALPAATPERELLIVLAFGVVLFTLVLPGLTLGPLLRRLRLANSPRPSSDAAGSA
jgi:monovalent cation:H+ antiporter, CPA1 family